MIDAMNSKSLFPIDHYYVFNSGIGIWRSSMIKLVKRVLILKIVGCHAIVQHVVYPNDTIVLVIMLGVIQKLPSLSSCSERVRPDFSDFFIPPFSMLPFITFIIMLGVIQKLPSLFSMNYVKQRI